MKRFLAALALLATLLPFSASAQQAPWAMTSFRSTVAVQKDGGMLVTEEIGADFNEPRHGIFRYVPYKGVNDAGKKYEIGIRLEGVTMDGAPVQVASSKKDDSVVWKIGDPDATLTGHHEYVLRYHVLDAVRSFDNFDEVYWNVTGNGWDVPLPIVTARVTLPDGATVQQSRCYTGVYGSTAENCTISGTGTVADAVTIAPGDAMTIAVGFPKGVVAGPSFWRQVWRAFPMYAISLLPILMFVFMYAYWHKHGKDTPLGTTVVQYEPPAGLTPAETQSLILQTTYAQQIAPTIIDLASRGYVAIEESEKKGLLMNSKQYTLILEKDGRADATLRQFERDLLSALFKGSVGERVLVSSLQNTFYKDYPKFTSGVMASLTERGYFEKNPDSVRVAWIILGSAFVMLSFIVPAYIGPLFATGAIAFVFGWQMPKWSPSGITAVRQARGYREFISKVEKYRAPWMEDQNIFFRTLPYAMAFGLGAKWAKAFAQLHVQAPSWYRGGTQTAWSTVAFTQSMSSLSQHFASASSSRPGSGGGGFSGGGSGGGGGGSW